MAIVVNVISQRTNEVIRGPYLYPREQSEAQTILLFVAVCRGIKSLKTVLYQMTDPFPWYHQRCSYVALSWGRI